MPSQNTLPIQKYLRNIKNCILIEREHTLKLFLISALRLNTFSILNLVLQFIVFDRITDCYSAQSYLLLIIILTADAVIKMDTTSNKYLS